MLYQTIITELKYILRNWKLFLLNLLSISLGISCILIIILWIQQELSYDQDYKHADRIVRVEQQNDQQKWSLTPAPLADELVNYPEIEATTRLHHMKHLVFQNQDQKHVEKKIVALDTAFFSVFDLPVIYGSPRQALKETFSVIISRKIAEKYFGEQNPVGEDFLVDNLFKTTVRAVIEDLPENSHLDFEIIMPIEVPLIMSREIFLDKWFDSEIYTYCLIDNPDNLVSLNQKISSIKSAHLTKEDPSYLDQVYLRPITQLRTSTELLDEFFPKTDQYYFYLFGITALLILFISSINFTNLSTALSINRTQSIMIKKLLGSSRKKIIIQYLFQSFFISFLSLGLALMISHFAISYLQAYFSLDLQLQTGNAVLVVSLVLLFLFIGLFPNLFPAIFFSGLKVKNGLTQKSDLKVYGVNLWKAILTFQYVISIALIICTIFFYQQTHFMKTKDLGIDKENLVTIPLNMPENEYVLGDLYQSFKNELQKNANIQSVSKSSYSPVQLITSAGEADWTGKSPDQEVLVHWNSVHYDYFKTLGLKLLSGRTFTQYQDENEHPWEFILNEEAVRQMQVENPIGMEFSLYGRKGKIIGVVEDFHYRHLKEKIEPMAFDVIPRFQNTLLISITSQNKNESISYIEKVWQRMVPAFPFEYEFADKQVEDLYRSERNTANLLLALVVITICISGMGILGFSLLLFERKTKEVGIRKVLGANIENIISLFSGQVIKWILIAFIIASPIAYLIINDWLQNFAYRIDISGWVFLVSLLSIISVTAFIVGFQIVKSAFSNPVDALRYE